MQIANLKCCQDGMNECVDAQMQIIRHAKMFAWRIKSQYNMTIEEIKSRKEDQTFDCKSIQIDPKALAVPIDLNEKVPNGIFPLGT